MTKENGRMMAVGTKIYPVADGFVFSVGGTWMPGVYGTERAAELASLHSPQNVKFIWDSHGPEPIAEALLDGRPREPTPYIPTSRPPSD